MRDLGCELGFLNYVTVPPVGRSGGLALFWNQSVNLSVDFLSPNLVDCYVQCNGFSFYLSFVYGHPETRLRNDLWERLERYGTTRREPWFILGDFNEILGNHEKVGGRVRPEVSFHDFRRMVRTCAFTDLKSIGDRFSWAGQRGDHYVSCCLDRTMANSEWHLQFPSSETHFLELGESDHRPLVTFIEDTTEERKGMFMYDSRLHNKEGFQEAVL
ncbi:unnamed protein product [Microthlaspi erraticum]|uniref:Endonuclease/exonuclease/phosphatase domain-containing protein n=1 Tax=Microthlaspi erraticum TaxID=1685480 RepID=A0A6D2JPK0_9BRAS|nr:unnamed protein product [Microthlaspi erraticum]